MELKKIVIISSGQPSTNPRMVKEADALSEAGHQVIVIYLYWNKWASTADELLLKSKKWKAIRVGGSPKEEKLTYLTSRLFHKLMRKLRDKFGLKWFIAEFAITRGAYLLYKEAKNQNGDLYIGHNPGAMAVAASVAKKLNVPCGFDAEDFHRHEYSDDLNHPDVLNKTYLEKKYLPQYDYITTSSPLITQAYEKLFPSLVFNTILNVFPKLSLKKNHIKDSTTIKLFWFSQTIGHNRGLEEIVDAIMLTEAKAIELHILGNKRESVLMKLISLWKEYELPAHQLQFYDPIPPDQIFALASKFDIGMATEIGVPYNRELCLTNKIFTYIQAGLAVMASDTLAQIKLLNSYPESGIIYKKNNAEDLSKQLKKYITDPRLLAETKHSNYELGQKKLCYEKEGVKLLEIVKHILN